MEKRTARLVRPSRQPTTQQLLALVDAWEMTVGELHALTPPRSESARFRRMLTYFTNAIQAARALPRAKDEMALAPVAAMADSGMKGGTIAHDYGLDECSLFPPAPTQAELERYVSEQMRNQGGLPAPGTLMNPPGGRLKDRLDKQRRP